MIFLKDSNSILEAVSTGGADGLQYSVDYVDITTTGYAPGSTEGNITSATTTTIAAAPAASTQRQIKRISVLNSNGSTIQTIQFQKDISGTNYKLTPVFSLAPGESIFYEDGNGWTTATITASGTILNPVFSGYTDYNAITMPATPGTDVLRIFARNTSGRMMPKWLAPSGVDFWFQPALFGNNVVAYFPNTGTSAGISFGTPWAVGTTVAHPSPTAGVYNQISRTTSTNVITTTNQVLGVSSIVSTAQKFWRGNGDGQGGFFFFARFGIETLTAASPNATRLFVGLQSSTTSILASDTVSGDVIGLWHDTTDGANVLNIVTRDNTTTAKNALAGSPVTPYSTGQAYDFYLYCKPNDSVIYYRLDNLNTATILSEGSISSGLPRNTVFLGPVVGMSNGTANIVASTVGIGVNRIYIESDR